MALPTQNEVNEVLTAYNLAVIATDYVDSLKFEMEQVDGDNYNMVWSEEFHGSFPPVDD